MAITANEVALAYVVGLGRAADKSGADYWLKQANDKNLSKTDFYAHFLGTGDAATELKAAGVTNNDSLIQYMYTNVFGRQPDAEGLAYWKNEAATKNATEGDLVDWMIGGAKGNDAKLLQNKADIAAYVAEKIENSNFQNNDELAKNLIKATTADNLATVKKVVDAWKTSVENNDPSILEVAIDSLNIENPGETFNYTTSLDTLVGTDKDDTFVGTVFLGNGTKDSTIISLDTADGKDGNDTLQVTYMINSAAHDSSPKVTQSDIDAALAGASNIENLKVLSEVNVGVTGTAVNINKGLDNVSIKGLEVYASTDATKNVNVQANSKVELTANSATGNVSVKAGGNGTVNASKATAVEIDLSNVANTLTVTNAPAEATNVALKNLKLGANLATAAATTLELSNVNIAATTLTAAKATDVNISDLQADSGSSIKVAKATNIKATEVSANTKISTDAENVDLTLSNTKVENNSLTLASSTASGTKNLNLHNNSTVDTAVVVNTNTALVSAVVDGSGKGLDLNLSAQTNLEKFDASAYTGDITLSVANKENSSIKTGSGNDTITVAASTNAQTIDAGAGVDIVGVTAAIAKLGAGKLVLNNFEGLKVTDALGAGTNTSVDMANWAGFTNIVLAEGVTTAASTISNLTSNSTITLEKAIASTKSLTLSTLEEQKENSVLNVVLAPSTSTAVSGELITPNVASLNITSKLDSSATSGLKNSLDLKTDGAGATKDDLVSIKISGDASFELGLDTRTSIKKLASLDASELSASLTGKGAAVLDLSSLSTLKTITLGSGEDSIKVSATSGATITLGAGNDKLEVAALGIDAASEITPSGISKVVDFSAGDSIKFNANVATVEKYTVDANLDFTNNLTKAVAKIDTNTKAVYFTYTDVNTNSTDTYLVTDDDGTVDDAGTYAIKLSGSVEFAGTATSGAIVLAETNA